MGRAPTAAAVASPAAPSDRPRLRSRRRGRPASALYEGVVYHRRFEPIAHAFSYRIFMPLFDLAELPELLDPVPLWSARRPAPARFRRSDYLGPPELPLAEAARRRVAAELGSTPAGPVRLLTNPRYLGFGMNPVSFYYLHDDGPGEPVAAIVAEVTNTPWGERRSYVLGRGADGLRGSFEKSLHVSPFMPITQRYRWSATGPGARLTLSLANHEGGRRVFEAGVRLVRREITPRRMLRTLLAHPPMTAATFARIYWNAALLKLKGAPYFPKAHAERRR